MTADVGWAFAIGAGRHLDYRVIAAPDFLIRSGEYGFLGDIARPAGHGQPNQLLHATTPGGQHLTIACVTQAITTNDITDSSHPTTVNDAVRDEQNRPLRLIFGIAIDRRLVGTVDQSDIEAARTAALLAYQSFLTQEDDFTVLSSTAFPLHSELTPADHMTPNTIGARSATSGADTPAHHPIGPARHGPGGNRVTSVLLGLMALAIVAVLAVLVLRGTNSAPTCPTPATTGGSGTTVSRTATSASATSATATCQ